MNKMKILLNKIVLSSVLTLILLFSSINMIYARVDDWTKYHHDLSNSGESTSTGPESNKVLWSYTTGSCIWSSPAVADGKVYVGSFDDRVYCLDALNGSQVWNYTTEGDIFSSPAVADGRVYVG